MKKGVCIILSILLPIAVLTFAVVKADASDAKWQDFRKRMDQSLVRMTYSFVFDFDGHHYSIHGELFSQDDAYKVIDEAFSVYDDKETQWVVNSVSKEVVIQCSSVSPYGFLENPSSLLELFGQNPAGAEVRVSYSKDGLPVKISADIDGGMNVTVLIPETVFLPKDNTAEFSFDTRKLDGSWVVTDMR